MHVKTATINVKTAQIPYTDPYTDVPIWVGTPVVEVSLVTFTRSRVYVTASHRYVKPYIASGIRTVHFLGHVVVVVERCKATRSNKAEDCSDDHEAT